MTMSIRLLIADDHEVIRAGIKSVLSDTDIKVIAEAANVDEVVRLAAETRPDLVLLDLRLAGGDGIAALTRMKLHDEQLPVLIFSTYDNPTYVARALALGASGYVLKGSSREELIKAVRTAASGEAVWSREDLRRVTGALATPRLDADVDVPLTSRESEVLRKMAVGLTNKEIAQALHVSYETIKEHVQHVIHKLGVSDRTQAAILAVRKGLA
jgi:DNA-binding NarL/FixJ family response regulator